MVRALDKGPHFGVGVVRSTTPTPKSSPLSRALTTAIPRDPDLFIDIIQNRVLSFGNLGSRENPQAIQLNIGKIAADPVLKRGTRWRFLPAMGALMT